MRPADHRLFSKRNRITCEFFLTAALLVLLLPGCQKKEHFPDTPEIEFSSFISVFDTGHVAVKGILTFSYHDGNGDIGLNDGDTLSPYQRGGSYYYNLVIKYFEKQNGVFTQVDLDPPLSSRLPVLSPLDPDRAIKGTVTDTIGMNPHPVHDTIQLKLFIYDHALHKSNEISTPEIILRRQ